MLPPCVWQEVGPLGHFVADSPPYPKPQGKEAYRRCSGQGPTLLLGTTLSHHRCPKAQGLASSARDAQTAQSEATLTYGRFKGWGSSRRRHALPGMPGRGLMVRGANSLLMLLTKLGKQEPPADVVLTLLPRDAWHAGGSQKRLFECQRLKIPQGDLDQRFPS